MKKAVLLTLCLLLSIFVGTSFAVEVTLFGPNQYVRTQGAPDIYTDTFRGMTGEGTLIIENGDEDVKYRISSAKVFVNGEQIFGPNDFNQKIYHLEAPVNLSEDNSLSIELRGKPGSYLTVEFKEDVDPPTVAMSADPVAINIGESATLSWSSANADTCTIKPDIGIVALAGLLIVSPTETTTYTITATGLGGTATTSAGVNVNHPPIADPQSVTTDEDIPVYITLTATDVDEDTLTYAIVSGPDHGTLTGTLPDLTYIPANDYYGSDLFTFKVNDETADSNIATISLTINPVDNIVMDTDYGFSPNNQQGGGGVVGESICILNGNSVESRLDLQFSSPNHLGLSLQATYNSQSNTSSSSGFGWTHTYSVVLDPAYEMSGQTYLRILNQSGRAIYFTEETSGMYQGAFNEPSQVKAESGGYIWYRLDGNKYGFSSTGRLLWLDDANGNRLALTYDAQDRLETVIDTAVNRVLTFNYNLEGLLESISGPMTAGVPSGIWVTYEYDTNQNLTSVTYADGSGLAYTYADLNDVHNLTEKSDKSGHVINTWTYGTQDKVAGNFSAQGKGVSVQYISDTQIEVTDAYGTVRTYTIGEINGRKRVTAMQGPAGAPYSDGNVVRWEYDAQMNLIEVETAGNTIHQYLNYDNRGNPGTIKLAFGALEERAIHYTYHPDRNAPLTRTEASVIGSSTKETIWDYDNDYDAIPNEDPTALVSQIIEKGFTKDISVVVVPYDYVTTFTYNNKGQVLSIDGPLTGNGDTITFTYDPTTGDLLSITRPLIGSASFSNYDAAGQVGAITDMNGQSKSFTYDAKGRVTVITNNADSSTSSINYNTAGVPESRTDEDGVTSIFEYDPVYGRLSKRFDHENNSIAYDYDAQGNIIEKSYYDPTNIRSRWKRYSYQDPAHSIPGKLFKEINPDDTFIQYGYDSEGNVNSVTDPNGHTTGYGYDPLNRLATVTQPGNAVTTYDYDNHGNLKTVTDAESHTTTYEYDDMGRVVATTSPDTGMTTYVYNAAGNLANKTDAKGITVDYDYDLLNRLTNVNFPDSTQDIIYTYDAGTNGIGRRTGINDPSGNMTFGYDNRGRLAEKTSAINSIAYTLSQLFTPGSRISSVTYPTGRTIDYTRTSCACSVDSVSTTYNSDTTTLMENTTYRPFGIAKAMDTGTGDTVNNVHDESGRLTIINPGAAMERTYTYDNNGNLESVNAPNTPWYNRVFTYDAFNRLNHAEGPYGTIDYTYDDVGNRLTKVESSVTDNYAYVTATNMLDTVTGTNTIIYTHDANGNITDIGDKILTYNQNNRVIMVEENSIILGEYIYNGLGQRVIKDAGGVTTVFHYDFNGNIIAESDQSGNFTKEYLYKGKGRLAMVDVATGEIFYYLNDQLGRPQILTNASNTVVWEGIYKPFGEAEVNPNSSVMNNFRLPGQYFDAETGLHYNYFRYYDPRTGRYLTPDPIGQFGGVNLFVYCLNNPINLIDPWGLFLDPVFSPSPNQEYGHMWMQQYGNQGPSMLPPFPSEEAKWMIDIAAQTLAEELSEDYINGTFASVLRRINFFLNIFDPFPSIAEAPEFKSDYSDYKDDPCE